MKKILSLLIALTLVLSVSTAFAASIPDIDNKENCVVDMADVISQETEDYLSELNGKLYEKTGASIVIATVDFTGSLPISEYAYEAFNKWQIGDKDKDNGLLLLMAIGQEDYFAVHGTGIEKALTAAELDIMLYENLEDDFAAEDYDAGAKNFYLAAYDWFLDYYDVNLSTETENDPQIIYPEESGFNMGKIIMWIMLIFIVIVLISALTDKRSAPKKTYRPRTHTRRGPHTSTYRRSVPAARKTSSLSSPRSTKSSSSTRSSSRSTTSRSSSTRSSSSSRSSSRSGGFGGGSTRGGGAGRRK